MVIRDIALCDIMNTQVRSELFTLQAWNALSGASLLWNIISGALSLWTLPSGKLCLFALIGCSLSLPASAFDIFVHWDLTQKLNAETHFVGGTPLSFSQSALDEVKRANILTDVTGLFTPWYHFDDEKLQESSQKILDNLIEAEKYLKEDPPDAEDARDEFGTAIHTLQDFYAHSNWADIKTNPEDIHPDLGVRILLDPPRNRAFCDNSTGALLPNLSGDITTGYFSLTCSATPQGKCHHGYEGLLSLPPCPSRPGINKDTASRIVHDRAYSQALKASKSLLKNLLTRSGIDGNMDRISAFLGATSVAVVMDTTGSMFDDLESVRNAVFNNIVSNEFVTVQNPLYILVEFNDPFVSPAYSYTNASSFFSKLNSLTVAGGDDCPEMSMAGILTAVKASRSGGTVWVFSDATSKQGYLTSQVLAEARRKNVRIFFGLTGSCSPVDKLYIKVAEETGGQIFFGDRTAIGAIFAPIEDLTRGNHVTISRGRIILAGSALTLQVPVDDTLDNVAISTSIYDGTIDYVKITRPDGTVVAESDPNVTISKLGNDNQIVTICNPAVGIWILEVSGTGPATVVAEGNSVINLDYFQFVTLVAGRYENMYVSIPGGNPIADGKNATALTRLDGPVGSYAFEVVDANGTSLDTAQELFKDVKSTTDEIILTINPPSKAFSVMARGITSEGNVFQRLAVPVYIMQGIKVSFDELSRPVAIPEGSNTTVMFKVDNFGIATAVDFSVTANNMTFLHGFEPSRAEIPQNSSKVINVIIAAPAGCIKSSLRITAIATDDKLLGNSDTVVIADICKPLPTMSPTSPPNALTSKASKKPSNKPSNKPTKKTPSRPTKKPR